MKGGEYKNDKPLQRLVFSRINVSLLLGPSSNIVTQRGESCEEGWATRWHKLPFQFSSIQKGTFEHEGDTKGEAKEHVADSTSRPEVSNPISDEPPKKKLGDIILKIIRISNRNFVLPPRPSMCTNSIMYVWNICKMWHNFHTLVVSFDGDCKLSRSDSKD